MLRQERTKMSRDYISPNILNFCFKIHMASFLDNNETRWTGNSVCMQEMAHYNRLYYQIE